MQRVTIVAGLVFALLAVRASAIPVNIPVEGAARLCQGGWAAKPTQHGQCNNPPTSDRNFLRREIFLWRSCRRAPDRAIGPADSNGESICEAGLDTTSALPDHADVVFRIGKGHATDRPRWQDRFSNGWRFVIDLPRVGGHKDGRLSSDRCFDLPANVPDGGATLVLLGGAFGMIAATRRRFT